MHGQGAHDTGDIIGGYELVRPIGGGGFGVVWLAKAADGHEVALKILHPELLQDGSERQGPSTADRFGAEARILQALEHDGLVSIEAVIEDPEAQIVAYAMEHLVGADLSQCAGDLDLPALLGVFAEVADTLAFLHDNGIVHRDVKRANIFVCQRSPGSSAPRVKLLDFGVAKEVHDRTRLTRTAMGTLVGSVATMAPEQFERLLADAELPVTGATDQWALGVSLYLTLSGRLPFNEPTIATLMMAAMRAPHQPLTVLPRFEASAVESALTALIDRCLAKRPEERFETMSALAAELHTITGTLCPDGEWLHDRTISDGDDVSRTEVLEALELASLAPTTPVPVVSVNRATSAGPARGRGNPHLGHADTLIRVLDQPIDPIVEPILNPDLEPSPRWDPALTATMQRPLITRAKPPIPVVRCAPIELPPPSPRTARATVDCQPVAEPMPLRAPLSIKLLGLIAGALSFGFTLGWIAQAL